MHVIMDCCKARAVWNVLIPPSITAEFFALQEESGSHGYSKTMRRNLDQLGGRKEY